MTDGLKEKRRRAKNVHPGGWAVEFERPISTILGSCVATCLYDPHLKLAGMNHFLLPTMTNRRSTDSDVVLAGDYAMEVLVNAMLKRGARKSRLVAKAFGGGNMRIPITNDIGLSNSQFAVQWLERERIPLIASDFGGSWSRKLVFLPENGDAFCRRMAVTPARSAAILSKEKTYGDSLVKPRTPGDKKIELF